MKEQHPMSGDGDDEAFRRLLDYNGRVYWLANGWCLKFEVKGAEVTESRPYGVKYSFTLHDVEMERLYGIDNAHSISRQQLFDHEHRYRNTAEVVAYEYRGADELICDFFEAIEKIFEREGIEFKFDDNETELDNTDGDEIVK